MTAPEFEHLPGTEFSRAIKVAQLPDGGFTATLVATPEERNALARRFGLERLDKLEARLSVAHAPASAGKDKIRVTGALSAIVGQQCVVTLEPVVSEIDEQVNLYYAPAGASDEAVEEELDAFDETADPEPIENGIIDLGEGVAQQLSLAIDPYPRSPSAVAAENENAVSSEGAANPEAGEQPTHRPFEGLDEMLRARKGK